MGYKTANATIWKMKNLLYSEFNFNINKNKKGIQKTVPKGVTTSTNL